MVPVVPIELMKWVMAPWVWRQISGPVLRLAQLWQDFQQFRLSIERLGDIINTPTERAAVTAERAILAELEAAHHDGHGHEAIESGEPVDTGRH